MTLAIDCHARRVWPTLADMARAALEAIRPEPPSGHEARVRLAALCGQIRAGAHHLPRGLVETSEARIHAYRARMGLSRNS